MKNIYMNGIHMRIKNFKLNFDDDEYKLPTNFLKMLLNSIQTINPTTNKERPNIKVWL